MRVDVEQSDSDLLARYQHGERVAVRDCDNAAEQLGGIGSTRES